MTTKQLSWQMFNASWRNRVWLNMYELSAAHPWVGTVLGLGILAVLVPVLTVSGGSTGSLGPSIPLFFLVPMLLASTLGGRTAGVVVSIACVAVWDWFFIPPLYTSTIDSPRDVLALLVFLFDALLTGQLATAARQRAEDAIRRARTSEALYDLSVALIGSHELTSVLPVITQRLCSTFELQGCAILLFDPVQLSWRTAASSGKLPDDLNIERSRNIAGILSWVGTTGEVCSVDEGVSIADLSAQNRQAGGNIRQAQFWPLRVGPRLVGVLELINKTGTTLDPLRDHLLTTLVNGAAIALEQERLFGEEQQAAVARESDRLKSSILSSVSHDLRTPLAGIKAAASSLLERDVEWSEDDRRAFLSDIDSEADRLARLVSNLLDVSRIEAGAIQPNREWEDLGELIERVTHRLRPSLSGHPLLVHEGSGLPPVLVDTVHLEQALTNVIENAAKYSPEGVPITVTAGTHATPRNAQEVHVAIADRGIGIPSEEREKIFDKFYRTAGSGRRTGGTGMGLAIVKGLVEANGGHVLVASELGVGSTFTLVLPLDDAGGTAPRPPADIEPTPRELPAS